MITTECCDPVCDSAGWSSEGKCSAMGSILWHDPQKWALGKSDKNPRISPNCSLIPPAMQHIYFHLKKH